MKIPGSASMRDCYAPAMEITEETAAREYLVALVEFAMRRSASGISREEAEKVQRANLGYFAGYYHNETRARVERLFQCKHPVFGAIAENGPPTAEQALLAGLLIGTAMRDKR